MTPLEQRIAKVINHDWTCDSRATDGEVFNESLCDCGLADKARAVVAVLPKADVSDEAIRAAVVTMDTHFSDSALIAAIRALLDVQAAAHAALLDGYIDQLRLANEAVDELKRTSRGDRRMAVKAHAEVEALRRWKAEATDVLTGWEAAFLALPREVRESPGNLGRSKAGVTHDWIRAALDGDA